MVLGQARLNTRESMKKSWQNDKNNWLDALKDRKTEPKQN
jgi:hypothetical protein